MGKVFSMLTRPIRNFNIESRAQKIISKDKPTAAPLHKSSLEEAQRLLRDNPESFQTLLKKDQVLDVNLKNVYVKSHDPEIRRLEQSTRALPLNRRAVQENEFGFLEPINVTIGRCTLRQAVGFITKHQEDSRLWNSTKIGIEYKLPKETVDNVLNYFRIYKVFIPDKKTRIAYAEPIVPKKRLDKLNLQKLLKEEKSK